MRITAPSLSEFNLVDEVLPEPLGAAHRDVKGSAEVIRNALLKHLQDLDAESLDTLLERRQARLAGFGQFKET